MSNTSGADSGVARRDVLGMALVAIVPCTAAAAPLTPDSTGNTMTDTKLSPRQLAIGPIAASMAAGHMPALATALNKGLDADLSVAEAKEVLVQLYAYTGFPRALNALGELMKVLDERRARGLKDAPGREAGAVPVGESLLETGTANQTRLAGAPVKGPLFEFAPAIDQFLKTHLFGDIFARDNLDWPCRELATVAALSALQGVESQLLSHIRISLNVGLTVGQLRQLADTLSAAGEAESSQRLNSALDQQARASAKS
ncbi:carboxymuconolactone decarboxylase family protein [Paucibacter sp. R3-3]|uniref:Carboxymuconolactone decarboxylase family protein n=1 Tax=Roseateles agri TaxID=3098619 RepID=A0ABU5DEV8_9BURK|nr:carboxymuconolactone decarboxylase family protein [Paucibacter sp. R3-3]MDY0743697.1 carboxymuconolactone decarboxylase family protein [Paucibacter sp. R3-3]